MPHGQFTIIIVVETGTQVLQVVSRVSDPGGRVVCHQFQDGRRSAFVMLVLLWSRSSWS